MNRSRFVASVLGGMSLILLSGSPAKASTVIATCGTNITSPGDYVLNSDITCNDANIDTNAGAYPGYLYAITVNADNVTIRLKGFSIRCSSVNPMAYKMSCQGLTKTDSNGGEHLAARGIQTNGRSNVKIQGPGMVQGFGIGVLLCGSPGGLPACGAPVTPSAHDVKVTKINVTGPDGRSDISDPIAGPRPRSFGIIAKEFIESPSTCPNWDSDDGHTHGNEIFGNSVDNHTEGIA